MHICFVRGAFCSVLRHYAAFLLNENESRVRGFIIGLSRASDTVTDSVKCFGIIAISFSNKLFNRFSIG